VDQHLEPIRFPEHLQQAIDHDEYGLPRENIPAIMDSHGWDLKHIDNIESPRVSEFEKASAESAAWVEGAAWRDEYSLLDALEEFDPQLLASAAIAIDGSHGSLRNPLRFALTQPFPIRLTLIILALMRKYGSGGEGVRIASGLPPRPPAPGHWGGRTPGFEQPLPKTDEDLDVGPKR
jgi:hypothetical protein